MATDLSALIARLKELPPGITLTVLIPKGDVQTVGGFEVRANETYYLPASLFVGTAQPDPDAPPSTVATDEREMEVVSSNGLNRRAQPDVSAAVLSVLRRGERVRVVGGVVNGYVQMAGGNGWILAAGLQAV